ncbi:DEAD/DEAH box helicase family protein [Crateriforma conspicua]|uniref:DEAD/DEAH box helicase family protein n=1 Tax=Crateriforma conspicua TaxID=2527996 RepID=UPI0011883129|nr:DEAD/DEAH box helicase family protein [Crateriforma conspicua]QDV62758.1 Type I restriction enzyme R protein [Crateriforma conspicua]
MFEGPEHKFQRHIADFLVRENGYAVLEQSEIIDTDYYFAEDHLYAFLKATQAETLERLEVDYGSDSRDEIFKALRDELNRRPLWMIIRSGLRVRGHDFKLYFPKARSSESVAATLYKENRITFIPELIIGGGKRPDFVFFLNGLPIITIELKHEKNQNVHDAVTQYVDRDHNDRIFQLPFLHVAADTADVMVATDPSREKNFRWFNTGLTNEPTTDGEYPVEYLYRQVLSQESLLEAIAFYLVRAPKQEATAERPEQPAFTIFPRYHQHRVVEKIADETQEHFATTGDVGRKFLVNHSAGSGKTLTMCWLADRLHSIYKPGTTEKMVNMIFLVTDRKSLDKNIREDLQKFSHLKDVVRFAKKARNLGDLIRDRAQIIVTTQQKFHYILKRFADDAELRTLRVAFLIDEAHRSQEGRMATDRSRMFRDAEAVSEKLGSYTVEEDDDAEEAEVVTETAKTGADDPDVEDATEKEDPQDKLAKVIEERDLNQLFVAFTATPSPATQQLFGEPFDTYSEAEAIAEGYIVDVVQSIISYKTLYNLSCSILPIGEEEKLYPAGVVSKALKNVAYQDPELIQYKAEVMLRIFEEQVANLIDGRSKTMIVATSRLAGLLYYQIIKRKLKERAANYKVLYAFTDFVHPDTNKVISEHELNDLKEGELIEDRFAEDAYRLMVVASKFQTGFDQPLLAGMFLDKAVADRNAVQTISRLNRCHPDKSDVVVVDFTNNAKAILKAFNKYRHGSPHDPDEPDSQKCLDLYDEILAVGLFEQSDAPPIVKLIEENDDARLQTAVNELRKRFAGHFAPDSDERKEYVYLLAKFVKIYHFLNRFFAYESHIREFAEFCEYVGPQLIKAGSVSELMKQVRATFVDKAAVTYEGTVEMPGGQKKPKPRKGGGGGGTPPKKVSVQDMIAKIREQFEITDEEALHIKEVSEEKIADENIQQTVAAHRHDRAYLDGIFRDQVDKGIQDAYALRLLYEQLGDPKYIDPGAIFDIMAYTVIQKGIELAESA